MTGPGDAPATSSAKGITPEPTAEEAAAIAAAVEVCWPKPGGDDSRPTPRWRWSGRWWAKPVPLRRNRPQL